MKILIFNRWINYLNILAFFVLCVQKWEIQHFSITLPKIKGSKSFDFKISQINNQGIKKYEKAPFKKAVDNFKKALNLSQQLRGPSQGILCLNMSLYLHKLGNHEEATKQFFLFKR
jgi:hypothetical protein